MRAFRVADRRHPIFNATGALLHGGRWNSPGKGVIYTAETYAGALLEVLVHASGGAVPHNHAVTSILIPDNVTLETLGIQDLSGWADEDRVASRRFGDQWLDDRRTAVLLVPSVVLQGKERNVLINPLHRDFGLIESSPPELVVWDERLFPQRETPSPSRH